MIQQRMHHMAGGMSQIKISQNNFVIGWQQNDKDHFSINVSPNDMDWTVVIEDTGDGIAWVVCVPNSGTGDLTDPNIYMNAAQENNTGNDRTANVRFSDDAGEADDVVLEVLQEVNPV